MPARSATPGISKSTCVRMRRSNAGSKFTARFVAKITTPLKPSSSRSSTLTTLFASRWYGVLPPAARREAMASASSKKRTAPSSSACWNTAATFFAVSPAHIDSTAE
jgi:hypothetical protein